MLSVILRPYPVMGAMNDNGKSCRGRMSLSLSLSQSKQSSIQNFYWYGLFNNPLHKSLVQVSFSLPVKVSSRYLSVYLLKSRPGIICCISQSLGQASFNLPVKVLIEQSNCQPISKRYVQSSFNLSVKVLSNHFLLYQLKHFSI